MSSLAKLLAGRKKDSPVWQFFVYDEVADKSKCMAIDPIQKKVCGVELSKKNPTNMAGHLKRFHASEFAELQLLEKEKAELKNLKRKAEDSSSKTLTIGECFQRNTGGWSRESLDHKLMVESVVDMIIDSCNPVTLVDRLSFRSMMKRAEPKFNLPGLIFFHAQLYTVVYTY